MNVKIKNTHRTKIILTSLGFGLGGILWGLEAYRGTVGAGESFTNPFSYFLGAVAMAVFGGLSLVCLSNFKRLNESMSCWILSGEALKIVGLGLVGWLVAFFLPAVWVKQLSSGSILILSIILSPLNRAEALVDSIVKYIGLDPAMHIGGLLLEFLVVGAILGLMYSLILDAKTLKTILWSAGGFALASLIGPILGNMAGIFFGSLLISYLFTFLVIGVIFGKFLSLGIYSKEKESSIVL